MLKKVLLGVIIAIVLIAAGGYAFYEFTPWPRVWLIRHAFNEGAAEARASIAGLVPSDISGQSDLRYASNDRDAAFDVYSPANANGPLPAIIWVHGGGFVSGTRTDLTDYLKILASRGFVTVGIDYTVAPEARFPTPVRQTNTAIAYVRANAQRFNIDPDRIFLAGDSAGAQIVAQTALIISEPRYAERLGIEPGMPRSALRGVVAFCGPYDPSMLNWESPYADFMRTVIWSYIGTRDHTDPRVAQMSVTPHVTSSYPPVFISVGNADPLAPQSLALAEALRARGVEVDALFFADDHAPRLDHEYQLLLATDAGRLSFDRAVAFLNVHAGSLTPSAPLP